jgi:hypothetical protein
MRLTVLEREEFMALAQDTFDPELWTEDELPLLRAARKEFEEGRPREKASPAPEIFDEQREPEEHSF